MAKRKTNPDGDPFRDFVARALQKLLKDSERADRRWEEQARRWEEQARRWKEQERRWSALRDGLRTDRRDFVNALGKVVRSLDETSKRTVAALREVSVEQQ